MATPFPLLREGGKLLPTANYFLPELAPMVDQRNIVGGQWENRWKPVARVRQFCTLSTVFVHFASL